MTWHGSAVVLACGLSAASYTSAQAPPGKVPAPRHIGTMTAFWQNRPMVDRWLVNGGGLQGETPKHMTLVRFLGGWNRNWTNGEVKPGTSTEDYDLAYRGDDGKIHYRWGLAKGRLDPYVKAGCGITIVLDNTPWCFRSKEGKGPYGNADPPTSFEEWGAFIEELCRQLVQFYGADMVNQWRFRMGTECQGKARFTGTQDEFHKLYDYAADAVKRVLPSAKFGPFNLAGNPTGPNVSFNKLVEHCAAETNHATGKVGAPVDFASVSIYTSPSLLRDILRTTNPQFKAQQKIDFWNGLSEKWPQLAEISREVHEFGILGNEFKAGSGEPGARGDAWYFHLMMTLFEGGMDRLYLWDHRGWLFSFLEQTVGSEAYSLKPTLEPVEQDVNALPDDLKAIATFERPQELAKPGGLFVKSVAFVQDDRTFVITSAYHEDRFVTDPVDVTVTLPKSLLPAAETPRIRFAAMTRTGSKYYHIRQDLAAAGLLDATFAAVPGLLSKGMLGPRNSPGRELVAKNSAKYRDIEEDLRTLKPFDGGVEAVGDGQKITFRMAPPSVMVVVLDNSGSD